MQDVPAPLLHDTQRIAALRRTGLLDAADDASFDRLARLASRLLAAPVARVSLLDAERQLVLGVSASGEPWASRREFPVADSLCRHVLGSADAVVVEDARVHPRTRLDPEVVEDGAVAYAGVPLTAGGQVVGTLCVVDVRPRRWTEEEVGSLRDLAASVQAEVELRRREHRERELEARLRESEELYRSVIEGAAEGFFLVAADARGGLRYQMMNHALVRITGVRADFVGRSPAEVFPAETAERVTTLYRQVMESGRPLEVEHTNELPGGTVTTRTRLHPLVDEAGTVVRVLGIAEDVTERVHARQQAEGAAARARAHLAILEGVLRALPVGVLITDAGGEVQMTNPAAVRIWGGRTPLVGVEAYGEYRARRADTGVPVGPEEWPIARAIRTGEAVLDEEFEIEAFDGTRRTILTSGMRIHDEGGRVLGGIAVNADITARKEIEEALRETRSRFQTAFASAPIGIALVGIDGRWLEVNRALLAIVGYPEEELLARTFQDITHPDDLDPDLAQARRLLAGEIASYQMEKRYIHRDGYAVWVQITGSVVRGVGDEPRYFIVQVQDVTERLWAQEKLAEYAHELERSNRELQDFAYVASHDLQEPLRKIQAFGDRLRARYGGELGEQGADYLARMQSAARRMQVLIQDLLAYSRVGSKAQPFVPVDLGQVARDVVADLQTAVEATGGTVELDPLPAVQADPLQMRQLLQNLVGNALKFHRPGVAPHVRVSGETLEGGAVRIRVDDNGIGFEAQYAERIFTVFERLHGRTDFEGTGIGLAICRKIARRHGGDVAAEGRPGQGASFTVTLAARPQPSNGGVG